MRKCILGMMLAPIPKVVTVTAKYLQCIGSFTVSDHNNVPV